MTDPSPDHYLREGDPDWGWEFRAENFVFARLDKERADAEHLPEPDRAAALARIAALRTIAAWHSCYVDSEGRSAGRCFTCDATCGFPCVTMLNLARIWQDHADFPPGWRDRSGDTFLAGVIEHGGFRNEYLAERKAEESK